MTTWQANVYHRRKARADLSLYKAYIGRSGLTPFALPGDIDLYARATAPVAVDTPALEANTRTIFAGPKKNPDGSTTPREIGYVHWLGRFGKGTMVGPQAGFELCVDVGLGNYQTIGSL